MSKGFCRICKRKKVKVCEIHPNLSVEPKSLVEIFRDFNAVVEDLKALIRRCWRKHFILSNREKKRLLIERDGNGCYLCGILLTLNNATIDHVYPISRGGSKGLKNCKISCRECNQKKGNSSLSEYVGRRNQEAC